MTSLEETLIARDNGFTGKDKNGRDIEKSGADDQWTKADVVKCPTVKVVSRRVRRVKIVVKFSKIRMAKYFKNKVMI